MAAITENKDWLLSTLMRGDCWALAGSASRAQSVSTVERRVFREVSWIESVNRLVYGFSVKVSKYSAGFADEKFRASS